MAASDGPSPTVNVAQRMGKTPNYAATYRKRLLDAFVMLNTVLRGEWGKPAMGLKTRKHHARSNKFIVKRANG